MRSSQFIHLEEFDAIEAYMNSRGDLVLHFGKDVSVFIESTHKSFTSLCGHFGLLEQENAAPGDNTEDGVPGGNEPAQVVVPQ